jgi:tRNA nucleotidyltransferase (CCA-adding enzyme)
MQLVESTLPINQALARLKSPSTGGPSTDQWIAYEVDDATYKVHRRELSRMVMMGLDEIPVCAISTPEDIGLTSIEGDLAQVSHDFSRRLTAYFPVSFVAALYELQSLMNRAEISGYVIGGMPRDLLRFEEKRLKVNDVDITVEGDALELSRFLVENSRNFTIVDAFPEFGTAKLLYKETLMMDLASTREEVYPHCGAMPVVLHTGVPLKEDVIRRDFTINALALSIQPLGQVIDYTQGLEDLRLRQIRILHPASFFEDPSRILRLLKFCARFDFHPELSTQELMLRFIQFGGMCYKGGGDRIKQELKGFLSAPESDTKSKWIAYFIRNRLYRLINMELEELAISGLQEEADSPVSLEARLKNVTTYLPEILDTLSTYIDSLENISFEVYLCFLFRVWPSDSFQKAMLRLGLTRQEREGIEEFRENGISLVDRLNSLHELSPPAEIYELFHGVPLSTTIACLLQVSLHAPAHMRTVLEALMRYKRKWENLRLELDGNDLINLGVPEGKEVGRFLKELLHIKLAGQLPDRSAEINAIRRILQINLGHSETPKGPTNPRSENELYEWEKGAWPDVAPPSSH